MVINQAAGENITCGLKEREKSRPGGKGTVTRLYRVQSVPASGS